MSASGAGLAGGSRGGRRWCRVSARLGLTALVMALAGWMPVTGRSPVAAASPATGTFPVTGEFNASGDYVLYECNYAQEFLTGSGDWSGLGTVTMDFEFCVELPPFLGMPWDVTRGSFTITAASGTLTGDIDGEIVGFPPDPEGLFPGELTFTVTGGAGNLEGASGSIVLDTLSRVVLPNHRRMIGTVSGTLALPDPGNGQATSGLASASHHPPYRSSRPSTPDSEPATGNPG